MISLCGGDADFGFLPADPFAARITALFKTYGADYVFAQFWIQRCGEVPTAAICSIDGNMTLWSADDADIQELSRFVEIIGFASLTCRLETATALGLTADKSSYIVRYEAVKLAPNEKVLRDYDKREIFELLCECGFEMGDYSTFAADVCLRLNKGTAALAAVADERLNACAFRLFDGEKSDLLGAVATRSSARGRGYASAAVTALASEHREKKVFLFCRSDELLEFYRRIGFIEDGRWAVCERKIAN